MWVVHGFGERGLILVKLSALNVDSRVLLVVRLYRLADVTGAREHTYAWNELTVQIPTRFRKDFVAFDTQARIG